MTKEEISETKGIILGLQMALEPNNNTGTNNADSIISLINHYKNVLAKSEIEKDIQDFSEIKTLVTALVLRKAAGGKLQIFGTALDTPTQINSDEEHLLIGKFCFLPTSIYRGLKNSEGATPNHLFANGGLDWKNYKEKIL